MALRFDWHPEKAALNLRVHGVSFHEAKTVFGDRISTTRFDHRHSAEEERWVTIGQSLKGRILVVVHADDSADIVRIISARKATRLEREQYEEGA